MQSTTKERARDLASKVPTKWILTGIAGVALAASAAFGGLNDAPVPPIPKLELGDASTATRVSLTVERVALVNDFADLNLEPDVGNRYLVIIGTAENLWPKPVNQDRSFFGTPRRATVVSVRVEGIAATAPEEILLYSDGTDAADLQPGVPVQLAYLWQVPADLLSAGDEVTVELWDETYRGQASIGFGDAFDDPALTATMTVALDDVDAG